MSVPLGKHPADMSRSLAVENVWNTAAQGHIQVNATSNGLTMQDHKRSAVGPSEAVAAKLQANKSAQTWSADNKQAFLASDEAIMAYYECRLCELKVKLSDMETEIAKMHELMIDGLINDVRDIKHRLQTDDKAAPVRQHISQQCLEFQRDLQQQRHRLHNHLREPSLEIKKLKVSDPQQANSVSNKEQDVNRWTSQNSGMEPLQYLQVTENESSEASTDSKAEPIVDKQGVPTPPGETLTSADTISSNTQERLVVNSFSEPYLGHYVAISSSASGSAIAQQITAKGHADVNAHTQEEIRRADNDTISNTQQGPSRDQHTIYTQQEVVRAYDNISSQQEAVRPHDNISSQQEAVRPHDNISSQQEAVRPHDNISSKEDVVRPHDNIFTQQEAVRTQDNIFTQQDVKTQDNIFTQQDVRTQDNIFTQQDVRTHDNIFTQQDVRTQDNIFTQQDVRTQDNIFTQQEAVRTHDNIFTQQGSSRAEADAYLTQKAIRTMTEGISTGLTGEPDWSSIDLLLIGNSGNGKSAAGNSILGKPVFKRTASSSVASASSASSVMKDSTDIAGKVVNVIDGPSINDSGNITPEELGKIIKDIERSLELCNYAFTALAIVLKFGSRFTKQEIEAIRVIKSVLGQDVVRDYGVCIITHGDNFDNAVEEAEEDGQELTFEGWVKGQTGEVTNLFQECNFRCVLFDNSTKDVNKRQAQLKKLMQTLPQGKRYSESEFLQAWKSTQDLEMTTALPSLLKDVRVEADGIEELIENTKMDDQEARNVMCKLHELKKKLDNVRVNSTDLKSMKLSLQMLETQLNTKITQQRMQEKIKVYGGCQDISSITAGASPSLTDRSSNVDTKSFVFVDVGMAAEAMRMSSVDIITERVKRFLHYSN